MTSSLRGKKVVITGGTSGIGEATTRRFVQEGAHVIAFAYGKEEVATARNRIPGVVEAIRLDVAEPEQVVDSFERADQMFESVAGSAGLDVLINNAGISIRAPFLQITAKNWQRVLAVNLDGMFYCAQQAARRMMAAKGGVILMTASTNGVVGHPYYADYNASKAGVMALTRTMALELAPKVRVNCICPGYVMTPMQEGEYSPEMLEATNLKIPLERHARPDEIAGLFAFLASDDAAYLTGTAIPIDGGETAGGLASRD